MRKKDARRSRPIAFLSSSVTAPARLQMSLSDAEILREAELIRDAIGVSPHNPASDILMQSRQLDDDDEDRVVAALEEMTRTELS